MKKVFATVLLLVVGCTAPGNDKVEPKLTPKSQPSQEQSDVMPGEQIGPLTQEQWADDWDIWYDTMLGSPPSVHVVKRFEGAEAYVLVKKATQDATTLNLEVIGREHGGETEPGVLRFSEEVAGEYETVFIVLPNKDILIYTKIKRTE